MFECEAPRRKRRPTRSRVAVIMTIVMCVCCKVNAVSEDGDREEPHTYTIDELLSTTFEYKDSGDLDMDPCKAGEFKTYFIV